MEKLVKYFPQMRKNMVKIIVFSGSIIMLLSSCGTKKAVSSDGSTESNELFQVTQVESKVDNADEKEISYEEANILKFDLLKRDDESYDEIIATFKITNNGTKTIEFLSMDFNYTDSAGNEICKDGRVHNIQLKDGKNAVVKTYSNLSGRQKSDVANINATSYLYADDKNWYEVNLQTHSVNQWPLTEENNVDIMQANIIEFTTTDKGENSSGAREVEVQIFNNGDIPLALVSYDIAYFDEEMNFLDRDGRVCDSVINVGNYAISRSYGTSLDESRAINNFGIYQYFYKLTEVDENGFNQYEVNLQSGTATGYKVD